MERQLSIAFQTNKHAIDYVALARLVDSYDFDAVTVYCDAPFHPPYSVLMLMAPHIRRARVGVAAVSPSRIHPMDIAGSTALLAEVAAGGVYAGIARGAWLEAHGITEQQPPVRTIREAVEVVRYFLDGRDDGYAGQVYQIAPGVKAGFPLPTERVPILIGTWGRKLSAVAGELADEVKIGGSANPGVIPHIAEYIRVGEVEAGRVPGTVGVVVGAVCVADVDRARARALARREVALYLPVVAALDPSLNIDPEWLGRLTDHVDQGDFDGAARLISDETLDLFAFSGDASDLIRQCEALYAAGARRVELGTPHGIRPADAIRLIGEQVLPALRHN